ncbi:hypothetical protein BGZ57DRAFT_773277 [Hyaloscypha finlandica]|nr:hypothetical protein BGZ57DRAFT_773277 [Hyaloscypha finlandica]KAH8783478.1 hypothetical protein F5882DRAFT_295628 [Hyaloscypha sp. PMI_1271]
MVSLSIVHASNSLISSTLPPKLVAVFIGATSGIGKVTLKTFAKYTTQPRIYFIGRSQEAADLILTDLKTLNAGGEYNFIKADVSLIRNVDAVCIQIKQKEKFINLLFLSPGVASFDRSKTSEHIHLLAALNYYTRILFITSLLPLLRSAPRLRRIISVGGGTQEGPLDAADFPALRIPLPQLRGHLSTLVTLGLESIARNETAVSIVHDYPGTVKTPLLNYMSEEQMSALIFVPLEECGERHLFLATSGRFRAAEGGCNGVRVGEGDEVAVGTSGVRGSGMYSVGPDCESTSAEVLELLAGLREKGMVDEIWRHTEGEFARVTELTGRR